jgi:hypothetical protein
VAFDCARNWTLIQKPSKVGSGVDGILRTQLQNQLITGETDMVASARKQNLETLPQRMMDLPRSAEGWICPWFIDWEDGKPEFRAMDRKKFFRAIREKLCWTCGGRLGVHVSFVASGMCGINRTSSEPPNHHDCAVWSVCNCPFLSNPRMVRREDGLSPEVRDSMSGFGIKRNPGVSMLWNTRSYETFKVDNGTLITMGEPESVEWWCEGRQATREEIQESIDSGIHNLEAVAKLEKGGLEHLQRSVERFRRYLP